MAAQFDATQNAKASADCRCPTVIGLLAGFITDALVTAGNPHNAHSSMYTWSLEQHKSSPFEGSMSDANCGHSAHRPGQRL